MLTLARMAKRDTQDIQNTHRQVHNNILIEKKSRRHTFISSSSGTHAPAEPLPERVFGFSEPLVWREASFLGIRG